MVVLVPEMGQNSSKYFAGEVFRVLLVDAVRLAVEKLKFRRALLSLGGVQLAQSNKSWSINVPSSAVLQWSQQLSEPYF